MIAFSAYNALRVIRRASSRRPRRRSPALVLHERITIPMLAGTLLILGAVTLARKSR